MQSSKKSAVAVCVLAAAAVIFFLSIIIVASIVPDASQNDVAPDYGLRYNYMQADVEWENDRSCHVSQTLEAEFLDYSPSHGIFMDIPVNSGEKVRNLKVKATSASRRGDIPYSLKHESGFSLVRIVVGDPDKTFSRGDALTCAIEYDYITPVHPDGADILDINPIGYGWASSIESATVTVTFPVAPQSAGSEYGVWVSENKLPADRITVSNDGRTFTVDAGALEPFNGVRVKYRMPSGTLTNYSDSEPILTIVLGCALVAIAVLLMLTVGRDKPLSPIVDFYPPRIQCADGRKRSMLPVQMGKIIDGKCSNNDVTSLIFYWANNGYLAIDERDDDIYLEKLCDVDAVTAYEKDMFDKMFSHATTDKDGKKVVAIGSLSGKFAGTVNVTKTAVNSEYKGKLYKRGFNLLSATFTALCLIYGLGFAVLTSLRIGSCFFHRLGLITVIPALIATGLGATLNSQYVKLTVARRRILLAVLFAATLLASVGVMFLVPPDVMSVAERIVCALCLGAGSAVSPFLRVRTQFYNSQLNEIIGFRNFLRDAEKDRLETMLKDNPQYYYDILPYANVLGVSEIWADKFKDLTMDPPEYYRGRGISMFDIFLLSRISTNVGRSLTYVPSKSSGRSFSGKGFGGGGGFGGFGGGGGGRW